MAVEMRTDIVIGGRTTAGFDGLSAKIAELAAQVNQISTKAQQLLEEGVDTYRDYEDNMLATRGIMLQSWDGSMSGFEEMMDSLEAKTQHWASISIFHTDDVSAAIAEAARAGWDYEQILTGIPSVMTLAQAGGMSLAQSFDYVSHSMKATRTDFSDLSRFTDEWVVAANRAPTTVSEIGEAMLRLGGSSMFADSTAEILTMTAALANYGVVGSDAGTAIRNIMLRLAAPTKKAAEEMMALGIISDEEFEDIVENGEGALDEMRRWGFSATDAEGNLKPFLNIFKELNVLTAQMSEGEQAEFFKTVFGMRTAGNALNLVNAAGQGFFGIYESLEDSKGAASDLAGVMMSGLTGSIETLLSKWEEFERRIGETLAPAVNDVADFLSGILDSINGMDDTEFAALTGAIEGIAAAGPFLLVAATAMEMMESPLGAATLLTVAVAAGIGAIAGALSELDSQGYANTFGDMALDMGQLETALKGVADNIGPAMSVFTEHAAAAKEAAAAYKEAGQALAEGLFMMMATGAAFDPNGAEAKAMMAYGESMYASVEKGLSESAAGQLGFLALLFEGNEEDESFGTLSGLISSGFDEAIATAEQKSQELRAAMTSAFADGILTEAEIVSIQSIIDQMNELMALESPANLEYAKLLNRSQTVSIDAMGEYSDEVSAARDAALADYDEQFENNLALLRLRYDQALRNGSTFINPVTGEEMRASDIDFDAAVAQAQARYAQQRAGWSSQYDDMLMRGWETAFRTSASGAAYAEMEGIVAQYQNGMISGNRASQLLLSAASTDGNARYIGRALGEAVDAFGGGEAMMAAIGTLTGMGGLENMERAQWMQQMLMIADAYGKSGLGRGQINEMYGLGSGLGTKRYPLDDSEFGSIFNYRAAWGKGGTDAKGFEGGGEGWEEPPELEGVVTYEPEFSAVEAYEPEDKTAYINYIPRRMNGGGGKGATMLEEFADGGRSDTPAIFGEDGAEWAIPEEHSERTADLLNAAREASGFTWDDLIRRNGGLNAGGSGRTVSIEYAPTINAADASDIERMLEEDKARVLRLVRAALRDERMRDEIENYA